MEEIKRPEVKKIDKDALLDDEVKIEEQQESEQEKQFTSLEKKMLAHGWDPDGELSAEDWIDNGFKVKQQKLDKVFSTVEKLKEKLDKQEKDAYAKARADLESQRIEAIEMADVERVQQIEKEIKSVVDPSVKEHIDAFTMKHHAWLNGVSYREQEMQLACGKRDKEIFAEGLPPDKHFEKLEAFMKGQYPEYFQEEPAPIQSAVEGKQPATTKVSHAKKKLTFDDLDPFQKRAALNLQKNRGIKIEDYIKRLQELDNR